MIRLGLCCIFKKEPIRFRKTTAKYLSGMATARRMEYVSGICRHNAEQLLKALDFCRDNGIGSFRINSQILPLKTHPAFGYSMQELPDGKGIVQAFERAGDVGRTNNIRMTFHPDQFVVLSSPRPEVVQHSIRELDYQAKVSEWVGADVMNIHAGGAYNDKGKALERFRSVFQTLPQRVRHRLTLENDDRLYSPADLLPVCRDLGIPLVYDVHHHRCYPDGLSVEAATRAALATWSREPLFHISSPKDGWNGKDPRKHHDFIDPADIPRCWLSRDITLEVEAKQKELAVNRLRTDLRRLTP